MDTSPLFFIYRPIYKIEKGGVTGLSLHSFRSTNLPKNLDENETM